MNKQAKKDLMFSMITAFVLICSVFVMGSGETNDVPSVTIVSPTVLSTIEDRQGWLNVTVDATIPSGDADSNLVNASLYLNITPNINHTWFIDPFDKSIPGNYSVGNSSYVWNQTIIFNGTSNQTNFLSEVNLTIGDGDYVNWQVVVCNQQGNCTYTTNTSTLMDRTYDTTVPYGAINSPSNASVYSNKTGRMELNFTATDDVYVQNVTLYMNFSDTDLLTDHVLNTNITFIENSTITNTGVVTGFITNTANTTLTGNFSDFNEEGDGFYYAQIRTCDYNGNCEISQNISFEWDTTAPYSTEVDFTHTAGACDKYVLSWNVTEASNYEIDYGVNVSNLDQTITGTAYSNTSMEINLTNVRESGETYYVNMTICDEHGNCNYTATLDGSTYKSFSKEWGVCSGWSAFALMNESITLGGIALAENSRVITTVSWWNETGQTFLNYIAGLSTNAGESVSRGDAYMVYANASDYFPLGASTVFNLTANTTLGGAGGFDVNISANNGGNWTHFGLLQDWKMYNLSATLDNETYYSYYNNSLQKYVDHIDGWLWNNQTQMEVGETVWVWGNAYSKLWHRDLTQTNETSMF